MQFFIVHEISGAQGRLRVRAPSGFGSRRAQDIASRLEQIAGVADLHVNARTGSVLFHYAGRDARRAALAVLGAEASAPAHRRSGATNHRPSSSHGLPAVAADHFPAEQPPAGGMGALLRYVLLRPFLPMVARICSAVLQALPFLKKGLTALVQGRVNVDVLDAAAIGISLLRRDFRTVSLLTVLLGFGEALEFWTRKKSLDSLAESLALDIDTVWVRRGEKELHVPLNEMQDDDLVLVRAGGAIPVDGVVDGGEALVNQSSMTGEALGVLRAAGDSVFAGTVVEEGLLAIRPTGVGDGTRLQKILRFIENSESLKAGVESKAMRLADAVVPFSFLLAGLVWLLTRNTARAASVLLVDYSCALRLATPLAVLAAMREGASHGVLVKGGRFLETLAEADVVVFDKTGTLTESRPKVAAVIPAPKPYGTRSRKDILRLAACLEEHFPHPVARAVVRQAEEEKLKHREEHSEVDYVVAHGIASRLHGKKVLLGSRHYIQHDEGVDVTVMEEQIAQLTAQGLSLLYLAVDGQLAGILGIEDPLRPEAVDVLRQLRESGVARIVMLTGDDERTAAAVARQLNITEYRAQVLPVDKATVIRDLQAQGHTVLMVGDGINDSPALSSANVGVALRDGADLAQEVADVVLTESHLSHLVTARHLGRQSLRRIKTNFSLIMSLNTLFLAAGLTGLLQPGGAAVLHNVTTVGVALNAMRPVLPRENAEGVL